MKNKWREMWAKNKPALEAMMILLISINIVSVLREHQYYLWGVIKFTHVMSLREKLFKTSKIETSCHNAQFSAMKIIMKRF